MNKPIELLLKATERKHYMMTIIGKDMNGKEVTEKLELIRHPKLIEWITRKATKVKVIEEIHLNV